MAVVCLMMFAATSANAQFNLGNLFGGSKSKNNTTEESSQTNSSVTDFLSGLGSGSNSAGSDSNSGLGGLLSGLTSVFTGEKQANAENIIGTWEYSEPAIVLKSDDILGSTAAKLAAGKLEEKMQNYLAKVGIKQGTVSITFNEDKTFVEMLGSKKIMGTWDFKDEKLQLTIAKVKTFEVTTQMEGNKLLVVTNADKLLSLLKTLGGKSTNSTVKTVTTLLNQVDGAEAGVTLVKK